VTLQQRARLATEARRRKAMNRAETLRLLLVQGECLKRAAWQTGVSYRTARRYRVQTERQQCPA
jgi:hypothetical protein